MNHVDPQVIAVPSIALQLYTMREPAKKDLAGTLARVREIGWKYVQWSGMPDLSAEKIRAALDKADLKAIAAHISVEKFETDFDGQVRFWKTVGAQDVAPGGMMDDCRDSLEAWRRGAKRLDVLGAKLRDPGIRLSYHNHAFEFETFPPDPRCKEDILLKETSPQNLQAEFDTAWIHAGGCDPAAYLRKYRGRCPVIHVKDIAALTTPEKHELKPLGQGVLNWPDIFSAGRDAGVEWYIYEQDTCEEGPFACAQTSFEFLTRQAL